MCKELAVWTLLGVGLGAAVPAFADDLDWQFTLTPYLWLPTIEGTAGYQAPPGGGGDPIFSVGPTDWLDLLNFGALVGGTARKGDFSISSNFVYLNMSSESDGRLLSVDGSITGPNGGVDIPIGADITAGSETELKGFTWDLLFAYTFYRSGGSFADAFAGARYFGVDLTTSWRLTADITLPDNTVVLPADGRINRDVGLWDAIVGVRGEIALGESRWALPYSADVGAGDSELTWNLMAGVSYAYGWGDMLLFYRHLEYDQGGSGLLQGFSFSGPAFGARFKF
jgi:hypothetical protein